MRLPAGRTFPRRRSARGFTYSRAFSRVAWSAGPLSVKYTQYFFEDCGRDAEESETRRTRFNMRVDGEKADRTFGMREASIVLQQLLDDLNCRYGICLGIEIWNDPMAKHRADNPADVIFVGRMPALENGAGLCAEDQVLRGSRSRAPTQPVLNELRCAGRFRPRTGHNIHGVGDDMVGNRDAPDQVLKEQNLLRPEDVIELRSIHTGRGLDDLELLLFRRILQPQIEHESIELRFGKRVGAFLLDRVLRCQNKEGF